MVDLRLGLSVQKILRKWAGGGSEGELDPRVCDYAVMCFPPRSPKAKDLGHPGFPPRSPTERDLDPSDEDLSLGPRTWGTQANLELEP